MKEINTWDELVERERELMGLVDEDEEEEEEIDYLVRKFYNDEVIDLEPLEW